MITAHVEQLAQVLADMKPLFHGHHAELALDQRKVDLDPQYAVYLERAALGQVLCVTLREAGAIVGYFVGFVAPALHYQRCLTLTMDIFWIHPDARAEDSLGQVEDDMCVEMLFETVMAEATRRGVQRVYFGSKSHRSSEAIFVRMGMVEADRYFSKWIGG